MDWRDALAAATKGGQTAVLVTVAAVEGSVPRGPGSKMLVTPEGISGSIGGGELEYQAIRQARDLMAQDLMEGELLGDRGAASRLERVPLGPQLGQCCGGVADLLYEPLSEADATWIAEAVALEAGGAALRVVKVGAGAAEKSLFGPADLAASGLPAALGRDLQVMLAAKGPTSIIDLEDGSRLVADVIADRGQPLYLFGAGHVGRAVVAACAALPFRVTWVDSRADAFPETAPANTTVEQTDPPRFAVARAPADAFFLVMTHSHDLDLEVCEAVLRRGDSGYLGLIGSATKRARFLKRLSAKGLPEERLTQLTCPIGLPGIAGKEPAVIAAAVAADLLHRRETLL